MLITLADHLPFQLAIVPVFLADIAYNLFYIEIER